MGIFHCPMGAAFYDDEGCIDCGMCSATTEQEMVEASRKIRAYLRSHAASGGAVKKIAVCGKGGVGKSTLVVLIANALRSNGYGVLVIDTDESNPGLYRLFGFNEEPRPLMALLSRFSSRSRRRSDSEWLQREKIAIADIPAQYLLNRDGLKLLTVGKIQDPFQGCACSIADMTRDLMGKLVVGEKEVVLVDMEAGIESFGRGVERNVDTVLVIVEPSFESMALAEKICYMAEGMGIVRAKAILNKVPSEKAEQRMTEELNRRNIKSLGTVYFDPQLSEAGFEGTALGDSRATEDVQRIVTLLLGEEVK